MHKWAKQILECLKNEVEAIGKDNLTAEQVCMMKDWSEIATNIVCMEKDYSIVEAMEKAEDEEEKMEMIEKYTDYPEKRFYDNYRYSNGRFAPKGRGSYRPYTEPTAMYHMTPEMYRDMDRDYGKMYYTEPTSNPSGNYNSLNMANNPSATTSKMYGGNSGMSMSRYDSARRNYEESKEIHKSNAPEDKKAKAIDLEKILNVVHGDIMEFLPDMTSEERTMTKQKLINISNSL